MMIPVIVERAHQPHTARTVGYASDSWSAERVAWYVKLPESALIKASIFRRKGVRRWRLIANVKFVERVGYSRPFMEVDRTAFCCPHCGEAI